MIADSPRMNAYAQALRQAVQPGSVVLDIGTGTGIMALLACQLGARRVYAIEPDDIIQVAREIAAANGCADRIEFLQNLSAQVSLPERADVVISDLRSVLPLFALHLPSIVDARRRFLAPGGTLIPLRDTLWAAVVEAPEIYSQHTAPWDGHRYGLNMEAARRMATNAWQKARMKPQQLLVQPQCWATLDYTVLEGPDASAQITWTAARPGIGHGFIVWFDALLTEGVCLSNAPGAPEVIYGSAFFPWSTPVAIASGDSVSLTLQAHLVGKDYVWSWATRVLGPGDPPQVKANFQQSTFFGAPLSLGTLQKEAASHLPSLNEDGQIDQFILAQMDGETPLEELARRLLDRFPARFAHWQDALTRVGVLSAKYSR